METELFLSKNPLFTISDLNFTNIGAYGPDFLECWDQNLETDQMSKAPQAA